MINILFIVLGVCVGILSGLLGIGGGVVLVPALVYLFKMNQHLAQGTTLALFSVPVGIIGALAYYRAGNVDIKVAALICIGFLAGSFIGARFATAIPNAILQKIFGIALVLVGLKMIIAK